MSTEEKEDTLESMNPHDYKEYVIKQIDEHLKFEGHTKAQLILTLAEKYEKTGYPIFDITDQILEDLGQRVTRAYVLRCLPDKFKKSVKVAAAKEGHKEAQAFRQRVTNTGVDEESSQVLESQTFKSDEDIERRDIEESNKGITYNGNNESSLIGRNNHYPSEPRLEHVSDLTPDDIANASNNLELFQAKLNLAELKIKAMVGDLPYADCIEEVKVIKLDKYKVNMFDNAIRASQAYMIFEVDIRTNSIINILTDTEYIKKEKNRK